MAVQVATEEGFARAAADERDGRAAQRRGSHNGGLNFTRYPVGRPDLYGGNASYADTPGYACFSHWVAQLGVRAISRSYEEQYKR